MFDLDAIKSRIAEVSGRLPRDWDPEAWGRQALIDLKELVQEVERQAEVIDNLEDECNDLEDQIEEMDALNEEE